MAKKNCTEDSIYDPELLDAAKAASMLFWQQLNETPKPSLGMQRVLAELLLRSSQLELEALYPPAAESQKPSKTAHAAPKCRTEGNVIYFPRIYQVKQIVEKGGAA